MILTDNEKLAERAKYITTQAKDNSLQYIHHEIGYNYRLSNIQAALGCAQLEQLPGILEKKRQVFLWYQSKLSEFSIAKVPQYADNNHWITVLQLHEQCQSNELMDFISKLNSDGIQARPVWTLNHLQEPYKSCQSYDIEVALELARKSLCLPSGTDISEDSIDYIQMCLSRYQ